MSAPHDRTDEIDASPTIQAFDPANAMIEAETMRLNEVSKYLEDLPETATALVLRSPKETAEIFERGRGLRISDIQAIRSINATHGLHFGDTLLEGMRVFDGAEDEHSNPIEEEIAGELRAVWEGVKGTNGRAVTGLFMPTSSIIADNRIDTAGVFLRIEAPEQKEGEDLDESKVGQHSSSHLKDNPYDAFDVGFTRGGLVLAFSKSKAYRKPSKPVALVIFDKSFE